MNGKPGAVNNDGDMYVLILTSSLLWIFVWSVCFCQGVFCVHYLFPVRTIFTLFYNSGLFFAKSVILAVESGLPQRETKNTKSKDKNGVIFNFA